MKKLFLSLFFLLCFTFSAHAWEIFGDEYPVSNITGLQTQLDLKAPLASPTFTGTPAAPTAAVSTNTTQLATTAYVVGQAATIAPVMDGSAAVGISTTFARQDHVHGSDTSRAPAAFNGVRITRTTDLAMAHNATVSIPWDAETYDTNSYHDPATNNTRLTAPVAGYYRIGANFVWPSNSTGFRALGYNVNAGTNVWVSSPLPVTGDFTQHNFSTELYLAAGSYVEIMGYQSSGVSLNLGGTTSFATMSYLGN